MNSNITIILILFTLKIIQIQIYKLILNNVYIIFGWGVVITLINVIKFILFWYRVFVKHFVCLRSLNRRHRMLQFLGENIYFLMFMRSSWPGKLVHFLIIITRCFEFQTQSAPKLLLKYIRTLSIWIFCQSTFVKFLHACPDWTIIWIREIPNIYVLRLFLFIQWRWVYSCIYAFVSLRQVWILFAFKVHVFIIDFIWNVWYALDWEIIKNMHLLIVHTVLSKGHFVCFHLIKNILVISIIL